MHAHPIKTMFRREFNSYFSSPLALVFIVIFLVLGAWFTFNLGNFFERGQADLAPFFNFHPWLYLFLVPAIAMRLWAEERRSGTIELLMTLPVTLWQAVLAKFLAAWALIAVSLLLTFPLWITVNYLGSPDNGVIFAGYLGSLLMAGAFLAVGTCLSAVTRSQVTAFILASVLCFVFVLAGYPGISDIFTGVCNWLASAMSLGHVSDGFSSGMADALAGLSFLTHFDAISKGVLDLRDVFFFVSFIAAWLFATAIVLDLKKAE